jgi:hypothetical protein
MADPRQIAMNRAFIQYQQEFNNSSSAYLTGDIDLKQFDYVMLESKSRLVQALAAAERL